MTAQRIESGAWDKTPRTYVEVDLRPYGVDRASERARFFFRPLKFAESIRLQQWVMGLVGLPLTQVLTSPADDPEERAALIQGAIGYAVEALSSTPDLDWMIELERLSRGVVVVVSPDASDPVLAARALDSDELDDLFGLASGGVPAEALGLLWALIAEGVGPLPVLGSLRPSALRPEAPQPQADPTPPAKTGSALPSKRR